MARLRRLVAAAWEVEAQLDGLDTLPLAKSGATGSEGDGSLVEEARHLQARLQSLLQRAHASTDTVASALGAKDAVASLRELETRLSQAEGEGEAEAEGKGDGDGVGNALHRYTTYELVSTAHQDGARARETARLAALEERISHLEKAVVPPPAAVEEEAPTPLAQRLDGVESRLALLTPERLAVLSRHMQMLLQERKALQERGGAESDAAQLQERRRVVDGLWTELEGREGWAPVVPAIVARLEQLRGVHEQAARQGARLGELEAAQGRVEERLQATEQLMGKLREAASETAATARESADALAARIDELGKRMAALK